MGAYADSGVTRWDWKLRARASRVTAVDALSEKPREVMFLVVPGPLSKMKAPLRRLATATDLPLPWLVCTWRLTA